MSNIAYQHYPYQQKHSAAYHTQQQPHYQQHLHHHGRTTSYGNTSSTAAHQQHHQQRPAISTHPGQPAEEGVMNKYEISAFTDAITDTLNGWMIENGAMCPHTGKPLLRPRNRVNVKTDPIRWIDTFCAQRLPPIALRKYVSRMVGYMRCSPECCIIALCFIRRLVRKHSIRQGNVVDHTLSPHADLGGAPFLNMYSVHRIFSIALVIAAKSHDDKYYTMSYYAHVCGVVTTELNQMEIKFLLDGCGLKCDALVGRQEYLHMLHKHMLKSSADVAQACGLQQSSSATATSTTTSSGGGLNFGTTDPLSLQLSLPQFSAPTALHGHRSQYPSATCGSNTASAVTSPTNVNPYNTTFAYASVSHPQSQQQRMSTNFSDNDLSIQDMSPGPSHNASRRGSAVPAPTATMAKQSPPSFTPAHSSSSYGSSPSSSGTTGGGYSAGSMASVGGGLFLTAPVPDWVLNMKLCYNSA